MANDIDFMCLFAICISSSVKYLTMTCCPFYSLIMFGSFFIHFVFSCHTLVFVFVFFFLSVPPKIDCICCEIVVKCLLSYFICVIGCLRKDSVLFLSVFNNVCFWHLFPCIFSLFGGFIFSILPHSIFLFW